LSTFNIVNRQITGAGHTRENSRASAVNPNAPVNTASVSFLEDNKEELAASIARVKSSRIAKKNDKKNDNSKSAQKDYIQQIKKIPDIKKGNLNDFTKSLLADSKQLKESDISSNLKKGGFNDPSHAYLALRYAKDAIGQDLNRFAFSQNVQATELYTSRLSVVESYIQVHMEKFGEEVFAGINSGQEQTEFSKMGLGTPQVLRDYYRSVIKEHKTVLTIYKDITAQHGISNFKNRCDFLMKFVSRHLECTKGKHDSIKLELMHNEIHLLRSVQSEIDRISEFFGQYILRILREEQSKKKESVKKINSKEKNREKDKDEETEAEKNNLKDNPEFQKFQHKVFEQIVSMVESVSVREAQVEGLNTLCKVTNPKEKIAVVNNLIACVSNMPETLFANPTSRIKIRMMIYNISEKLMAKANETIEEFSKSNLYYKAGGFKSNAADPALESLKIAAYFPERDVEQGQDAEAQENSIPKTIKPSYPNV